MRRWILFFTLLTAFARGEETAPTAPKPEIPALLKAAIERLSFDTDRWAYTETRVAKDTKGVSKGETIVKFDPSKPYAEQYTPVKVNGQPPTEKQLRDYARRGERREKHLEEKQNAPARGADEPLHFSVNGEGANISPERATVAEESDRAITYEIPMSRDPKGGLPVEKLQLFARVNKEHRTFENISLRLRESVRLKLVVKVTRGEASIDFTEVDPKYPPVVTSVVGGGLASIMFIKFGGDFAMKREEFRRVKPYGDRFEVKIGPLKSLDF